MNFKMREYVSKFKPFENPVIVFELINMGLTLCKGKERGREYLFLSQIHRCTLQGLVYLILLLIS